MLTYLIRLITAASICLIGVPSTLSAQQNQDEVHEWAEVFPQFAGGTDSMNAFIRNHLPYPPAAIDSNIEGRVWIRAVIDKQGRLSAPEILKPAHPLLDSAGLLVVKQMPAWTPGMTGGQAVMTKVTIPITFQLLDARPELPYPTFKSGDFNTFIRKNMRYPPDALKEKIGGVAIVRFTIDESGKPQHANIVHSADRLLDQEAVRLINLTDWYPAVKKGKSVRYRLEVPVVFSPGAKDQGKQLCLQVEDSTLSLLPSYPGGMVLYPFYLIHNTRLVISDSSKIVSGYSLVRFRVSPEGSIDDISIAKSLGKTFDSEAVRLVKAMPLWEPGMKDGLPVPCYVRLQVLFRKQSADDEGEMSGNLEYRKAEFMRAGVPKRRLIVRGPNHYLIFDQ